MGTVLLSAALDSLDSIFVFAGHGDSTGSGPAYRETSGGDDSGGIPPVAIAGVVLLSLATIALLVGLDRPERLRSLAPALVMGAIVTAPLIMWTTSSGGEEQSLFVERALGNSGAPEFVISVAEDDLSGLSASRGKRNVRLECLGRDGRVLLATEPRWPFREEAGFAYPHAHQRATADQLQLAERCRIRGLTSRLEARVRGPLRPKSDAP